MAGRVKRKPFSERSTGSAGLNLPPSKREGRAALHREAVLAGAEGETGGGMKPLPAPLTSQTDQLLANRPPSTSAAWSAGKLA